RDRAIGTLNRERAQLSGVFQMAVDTGYIFSNPARKVKSIPVDNARDKVLEREDEAKLFAALTGKDAKLKPIAVLGLYAGLRLGEALNLTWEQVDLSEKPALTIKGKAKGRKKKKRVIPLRAVPFKLLQDLRAKCDGKGRVFTARGLHPVTVSKRFATICDEIGLPDVTFHTLRHTFLSRLVDVTGNAAHAQHVAGHSDLTTTQGYLHSGEKAVRESMKKMDDWEAEKGVFWPIADAINDTKTATAK
ncbi:MAG TPA: site-specific integrase, partial [Blastocatellia bacterium]